MKQALKVVDEIKKLQSKPESNYRCYRIKVLTKELKEYCGWKGINYKRLMNNNGGQKRC